MISVSTLPISIVAIALALSACSSKADPAPVHESFDAANAAWAECRAKVALAGVKSSMTTDRLVDEAFKACKAREDEFYAAGVSEFGPEWRKSGGDVQREMARQAMLNRVNEIRAGKPPSDPFIARGKCNGAKTESEVGSLDPMEVSIDRILAACKNYQDAVEEDARSKFGDARARQIMAEIMPKVRALNAAALKRLRESRNSKNARLR